MYTKSVENFETNINFTTEKMENLSILLSWLESPLPAQRESSSGHLAEVSVLQNDWSNQRPQVEDDAHPARGYLHPHRCHVSIKLLHI